MGSSVGSYLHSYFTLPFEAIQKLSPHKRDDYFWGLNLSGVNPLECLMYFCDVLLPEGPVVRRKQLVKFTLCARHGSWKGERQLDFFRVFAYFMRVLVRPRRLWVDLLAHFLEIIIYSEYDGAFRRFRGDRWSAKRVCSGEARDRNNSRVKLASFESILKRNPKWIGSDCDEWIVRPIMMGRILKEPPWAAWVPSDRTEEAKVQRQSRAKETHEGQPYEALLKL